MTGGQLLPPTRCSSTAIAAIVVFSFAFLFGIGSFSATVVAWDDDYSDEHDCYDDDDYCLSPATKAAISQGAFCLLLFIIAVPLTYCSARIYLQTRNAVGSNNGPCMLGYPIAAWILYGIVIVDGLAAIGVGAADGEVAPGFVASIVVLLAISWAMMQTYAELARRRQPEVTGGHWEGAQQQPVYASAVPHQYEVPIAHAQPAPSSGGAGKTETRIVEHPDGSKTVTKTTFLADGSKMVEVNEYDAEAADPY